MWGVVSAAGNVLRGGLRVEEAPFLLAAAVLVLVGTARAWGHVRVRWSPTQAQVPRHWIVRSSTWQVSLAWGALLGSALATRVVSIVLYAALCLAAVASVPWAVVAGAAYGLSRTLPLLVVGLSPGSLATRLQRHMALHDRAVLAPQFEGAAGLVIVGAVLASL